MERVITILEKENKMKHKKLLAILLSLAIMVTFMPMMAFAQDAGYTTSWAKDYKSVTVTNNATKESATFTDGQNAKVKYTWANGAVTASLDWSTYDSAAVSDLGRNAAPEDFYDLSNAFIGTSATDKVTTVAYANFAYAEKAPAGSKVYTATNYKVFTTQPSYTDGYDAKTVATTATLLDANKFDTEIVANGFAPDTYTNMPVTLVANVLPYGVGAATSNVNYIGTVPEKAITVQGMVANADQIVFAVDDLKEAPTGWTKIPATGAGLTAVTGTYDGKTHKIVNSEVPGLKVVYEVQNANRTWDEVSAVEFKDVTATPIQARYTVYKDNVAVTGYKNKNFTVTVNPTNTTFSFEFDEAKLSSDKNQVAKDANPLDYVKVIGVKAADKETALKLFSDKYEIKVADKAINKEAKTWTIVKKEGVKDADIYKSYKAMMDNYKGANSDRTDLDADPQEVTVYLVEGSTLNNLDDDVTFTKAQGQKYSYKKVLKKKSKSFKVVAVADSGKAVQYSIVSSNTSKITINAETGKITVKKGLKKGTYTVTVKAKTVAGDGFRAASDKATLQVKVTK
jgi:hypothetical protein